MIKFRSFYKPMIEGQSGFAAMDKERLRQVSAKGGQTPRRSK